MPTVVRSFCKINLGLVVGPPRPDDYHALTTLYQTLALHDLVTVAACPAAATRITLEADHPAVPSTAAGNAERNTAFRMVAAALARLGQNAEVHLRIQKRLPVQGGLGAGSANAVAALLGLERELDRALPGPERLVLAAQIGSDVPLFLLGGTVLGLNRGEAVYPFPDLPALPVVVAVPPVGISTAEAFRDLDRRAPLPVGGLTAADTPGRLEQLSRVLAAAWTFTGAGRVPTGIADPRSHVGGDLAEDPLFALVHTGVENDFEEAAFRQHPSLREIKRALAGPSDGGSRALHAALSGSGSALFGIFRDPEAAQAAQQRVAALGIGALMTEMLTRDSFGRLTFA